MERQLKSTEDLASVNSKCKTVPKNIRLLVLSIGLSVLSAVTPIKAATWDEIKNPPRIEDAKENNTLTEQVNASKELLFLISNIVWKEPIAIKLTKNNFDSLYIQYIKLRPKLWPKFEEYTRKFLLDCYIDMLKNWYKLKWNNELDSLTEKLGLLSSYNIKINISPDIPSEFQDEKTVTIEKWTDNKNILIIEKKWLYISKDPQINVNIAEVLNPFKADIPASFQETESKIAWLSLQSLKTWEELWKANIEIWKLSFEIKKANETIWNLEKKAINDSLNAKKEAELAKTNAEKNLQEKLAELNKQHEIEKTKLNKDISDRDNKYNELNKQFEDAKKKALADAELAKTNAEKNLQQKLAELNKQHEIEKTKLNQDIENLRTLINNSEKLYTQEKASLSNRIKELEGQVIELSNKNSDLKTGKQGQSEIKPKSELVENWGKDKEIAILKTQNEDLKRQLTEKPKNLWDNDESKKVKELEAKLQKLQEDYAKLNVDFLLKVKKNK